MYIRLLYGDRVGELQFFANHVARKLIENGRAVAENAEPVDLVPTLEVDGHLLDAPQPPRRGRRSS